MHSKLLICFIVVLSVTIASAIVCAPDYCTHVDCANSITRETCETNDRSLFKPKGGFCGCCPSCVTLLGKLKY